MEAKYTHDDDASTATAVDQYGPIQVRHYQKAVPTLATGRRSKNLVLDGEEAMKREKKRERNREAARKIKEKRETIEVELNSKLQELEREHCSLQSYLVELQHTKQSLQQEVNNMSVASLDELLRNDSQHSFSSSSDFLSDIDLFDESIQRLLSVDSPSKSELNQYV